MFCRTYNSQSTRTGKPLSKVIQCNRFAVPSVICESIPVTMASSELPPRGITNQLSMKDSLFPQRFRFVRGHKCWDMWTPLIFSLNFNPINRGHHDEYQTFQWEF